VDGSTDSGGLRSFVLLVDMFKTCMWLAVLAVYQQQDNSDCL